jgi:raffinose/stachyose/melibiose transport system substrate-binding protein
MRSSKSRHTRALMAVVAGALALAGCSAGDLGGSDDSSGGGGKVSLSFLVDNGAASVAMGNALGKAFTAKNPDITVKVETRPGGADGDNIIKTRLSTGDMTDVFMYNSGSLFQAINPKTNLVPLTDEKFMSNVEDSFFPVVTAGSDKYGVPFGTAFGGGVLYNKPIFDKLGLQVPKTWAEFMANNKKIKADGVPPVIQSYQTDTWTSQLFVLGDFHNVAAAEPDFAEQYTAGKKKYATDPAALKSFERLQQVRDAGYMNKDFASTNNNEALKMVATGTGAQYPMLTAVVPAIVANTPNDVKNVGFFALPGDDAASNGLTTWYPAGVYIPTSTKGDKLTAAKKFLGFIATTEACDVLNKTTDAPPTGPYMVKGCTLPADVPPAVQDVAPYFEKAGAASPALEFLSPIKGPNLEQILIEVGSGIRTAESGAKLYDEDVKKQAQQLGLPGWD